MQNDVLIKYHICTYVNDLCTINADLIENVVLDTCRQKYTSIFS